MKISELKQLIQTRLLRNTFYIVSSQIIALFLGVFFIGLITRGLSVADFGLLSLFITFSRIAAALGEFGIGGTVVRFSSYYFGGKEEEKAYSMFKIGWGAKLLLNLVILIIGVNVSRYVALNIYDDPALIIPLKYAFLVGFLASFREYFTSILRSLNRFRLISVCFIVSALFQLGVIFFLVMNDSLTLFNAMIVYLLTPAIFFLASSYAIPWAKTFKSSTSRELLPEFFSFGKWMLFVYLLDIITFRLDILMLKYFLSSEQVGYYFPAFRVVELLWFIPMAVSLVLLPSISRVAAGGAERFKELPARIITNMAFITLPAAFGMLALSHQIIPVIFGSKYMPAIPVLALLIPAGLARALRIGAGELLVNIGRVKFGFFASLLGFILGVVLNLVLIPRYGIEGAAIATSITFVIVTLVLWVFVFRPLKPKIDIIPIAKYFLASVAMAGIVWSLNLSGISGLAIGVAVGVALYAFFILILFNRRELIGWLKARR